MQLRHGDNLGKGFSTSTRDTVHSMSADGEIRYSKIIKTRLKKSQIQKPCHCIKININHKILASKIRAYTVGSTTLTLAEFQSEFYGQHITMKLGVFTYYNECQRIDESLCTFYSPIF